MDRAENGSGRAKRKYRANYHLTNSLGSSSELLFYTALSFMESRLLQQATTCCETNLLNWSEKPQHCTAGWVFYCYFCCLLIWALRKGEFYVLCHISLCLRLKDYIWTYDFIISQATFDQCVNFTGKCIMCTEEYFKYMQSWKYSTFNTYVLFIKINRTLINTL